MSKQSDQELEEEIAKSVVQNIPDEKLISANKFLSDFLIYRKIIKLNDTYITGVKEALARTGNGKIYMNYNLDGAVTGRLSCKGADTQDGNIGVSFHTLPREDENYNIRSYAVSPPGWKFITADMKAMELRVLAHIAKENNMLKAFREGTDLHTYSASMTFNKKTDEVTKVERQIAKEVSFLTVYGGTEYTLAAKRRIPVKKAKKIIDSWMAAFPGVPKFMEHVHNFIKEHGYAYTIFGRHRNLPNVYSKSKSVVQRSLRQGLNFTVQSAASDYLVCGIIGINSSFRDSKLKAKIVATVHDSVEIICPEDEVTTVLGILYNQLVNYPYAKKHFGLNLTVPMEIEVEVGDSFGTGEKVTVVA